MNIFFLKKLRKLFKSIGKLENKIIDKLVLIEKKNNLKSDNYFIKSHNFTNFQSQLKQKKKLSEKTRYSCLFLF